MAQHLKKNNSNIILLLWRTNHKTKKNKTIQLSTRCFKMNKSIRPDWLMVMMKTITLKRMKKLWDIIRMTWMECTSNNKTFWLGKENICKSSTIQSMCNMRSSRSSINNFKGDNRLLLEVKLKSFWLTNNKNKFWERQWFLTEQIKRNRNKIWN